MAKMLMLRWKPINTGNGIWFDSNPDCLERYIWSTY